MKITTSLLILLLTTSLAFSQKQETIDSDRPGQSYSATTLGKNVFQLQSGIITNTLRSRVRHFRLRVFNNEIRYGINDQFEINSSIGYSTKSQFPEPLSGFSEFGVGARYQILEQDNYIPSISLLGKVLFSLNNEYANQNLDGILISANISQKLTDFISLSSNLRLLDFGFGSDLSFLYTLNSSFSLTKEFSAYLEIYGKLNGLNNINIDGGIGYLLTDDILVDASVGFIEFDISKQWFSEVGISFRFGGVGN